MIVGQYLPKFIRLDLRAPKFQKFPEGGTQTPLEESSLILPPPPQTFFLDETLEVVRNDSGGDVSGEGGGGEW